MNRAGTAVLAGMLALASGPASAAPRSEMTVGVQDPPPRAAVPVFRDLSPAEQAEVLRLEQARRDISIDCRKPPESDLDRAVRRLRCGR